MTKPFTYEIDVIGVDSDNAPAGISLTKFASQPRLYFVIMHSLISSSILSGTKMQEYHQKIQTRILIKRMVKEGFTKEEIINVIDGSEQDF